MILVDTSVWVEHWRKSVPELARRLGAGQVLVHPIVIGELSVGQIKNRTETIKLLMALPQAAQGGFHECMAFLEWHKAYGAGLGWNDIQLLTSAKLGNLDFWTFDKPLAKFASKLGLAYRS